MFGRKVKVSNSGGSRMNLICIDPGRASIKVRAKLVKTKFLSIISEVDMSLVKSFQWIKHTRFLVLNKKVYCVGDDAVRYNRNPLYVNNDDLFVENIKFFVMEALLRMVEDQKDLGFLEDCKVAIDMTWNNYRLKDKVKKEVKGIKRIVYQDEGGYKSVDVNVTGMYFLYQGWCGLMDHVLDNEGLFPEDKQNIVTGRGVVVDVGRSTTDITYVNKLIPYEGESVDFGTLNIFQKMRSYIHEKHGLNLKPFEIEDTYRNKRTFKTLSGVSLNAREVYNRALQATVGDFREVILERLGGKVNDFILLMGGGGDVFHPLLGKEFGLIQMVDQPEFANAQGMYKFLTKMNLDGKGSE